MGYFFCRKLYFEDLKSKEKDKLLLLQLCKGIKNELDHLQYWLHFYILNIVCFLEAMQNEIVF